MLTAGFHPVPQGMLATVVTYLEMTVRPALRPETVENGWQLERMDADPAAYRALYRAVGIDWLWFSRLAMDDAALAAEIAPSGVEIYRLSDGKGGLGLLELDFRREGECELLFFGLSQSLIGGPAGRFLMNRAIEKAFAHPIRRFWLHTCTLDHPKAIAFYTRSGFTAYKREVEIAPDPRLDGSAPPDVAPHIPLLAS